MKAVVYEDINRLVLKECEKPKLIEDTDVILKGYNNNYMFK